MKNYIKRYWAPSGSTIPVDSLGFLIEDTNIVGRTQRQGLRQITEIPERVSVLLGGSGTGKSTDFDFVENNSDGSYVHRIDLVQLSKDSIDNGNLKRCIVENVKYTQAVRRNQPVILLIDSFDECSHMERKLVHSIVFQLESLLRKQDSVRIASRPDDLTTVLIESLRKAFESDDVSVYETAPLSRSDVRGYANRNGIDPDSFMQYILDHDLTEFAVNPQLLTFMVSGFRDHASIVNGRVKLYRLQLLRLLEESNRITSSKRPSMTDEQVLTIAERCALATIFSGRNRISKSSISRDESEDVVPIDVLIHRRYHDQEPLTNRATIEDVLSTPLFRIHSDGRFEWSHRSYAEYLAACAISKSRLKRSQILSLFTTTVQTDQSVPSQLFQCASFLVELKPELFVSFLELDPEVCIVADISQLSNEQKALIIEEVLRQYELRRGYDRIDLRKRYRRLAHPTIADQLRPLISRSGVNAVLRRVVIDIAKECNVIEVLPQLIELALDHNERLPDRVQAVHAINSLADADHVKKLRPLLYVSNDEDPQCELRGSALQGLWPSFMDAGELASVMTTASIPHLIGSYHQFLRYQLPERIKDDDLPEFIKVLTALSDKRDDYRLLDYLMLVTVSRSLNLVIARVDVCTALCDYILVSARRGRSVLGLSPFDDTESLRQKIIRHLNVESIVRRTIVAQMAIHIDDEKCEVSMFVFEYGCLVSVHDLDWYIEQLDSNLNKLQRKFYCSLIDFVSHWNDAAIADRLLSAAFRHHDLRDQLRYWIHPVDLETEKTARIRQSEKNTRNRRVKRTIDKENVYVTQLRNDLEFVAQGDHDAWIRICKVMSMNIDSGLYDRVFDPNIANSQFWMLLDEHEQIRVCEAAMGYLEMHQPREVVIPGLRVAWESLAAYKAIVLLYKMRNAEFLYIDSELFRRWIPSAMFYPTGYGFGDDEMHAQIISVAYKRCPRDVLDSFKTLLQHDILRIREKGADKLRDPSEALLFCQHKLSLCWDDDIERIFMDAICHNQDLPEILPSVLSFMLSHESLRAKEYVLNVLELSVPDSDADKTRWIACAVEAIAYTQREEWGRIWSILQAHNELSKSAFLDYVDRDRTETNNLILRLTEKQQADLYIWLEEQFPRSTDTLHDSVHFVSSRDKIGDYRDVILNVLKYMGTIEAVVELQRIEAEYPELHWLRYVVVDARKRAHDVAWEPIEPEDLFEILSHSESRLVRSGRDLGDVIVESMQRLTDKLQGHTPMAELLWNTCSAEKATPKDETALSNYIKHHLESDLQKPSRIIVNREVVIDSGGHKGKKTDIHLDCFSSGDDFTRIKAVIEVKCCWNEQLMSAMESQLVSQYMNDSECCVGVYIVGFYHGDCWDEDHRRKKGCRHESREDLDYVLRERAERLSNANRIIVSYVLDVSLHQ